MSAFFPRAQGKSWIAALFIVGALWWAGAAADLGNELIGARERGCGAMAAPGVPLVRSSRLDDAARAFEHTRDLAQALRAADYRAVTSTAIVVRGSNDDAALARAIVERNCAQLLDPSLREIGLHRQGDGAWIVLASPFELTGGDNPNALNERVRLLVNEARRVPRSCGNRSFGAARPLSRNAQLERAARAHADNMALFDYLDHTGRDGSQPRDRLTRTGYAWRAVGENIAGGPTTAQAVVEGWLKSPGHCANIMSPAFTEIGVAFAVNRQSKFGIYWAQVFAAPR